MHQHDFFQHLGFSEYEAKALSSFSKLKSATPKQIHEDSLVPQNKLYQIIKSFEKLGIIASLPSETKKYKLINFKTFVKTKISEKENHLKLLKEHSKSLEKEDKTQKEQEFIFSLIKGQSAVMDRIAESNKQCKKEILGVQRNWKVWGEGLRAMQDAVKRGVNVKLIGEITSENKKRVQEWKEIGCSIKAYNKKFGEYPLRFSIFDSKYARITIGKPEIQNPEDYITIWTDSKPLIAILRKQFLEMWKESEKL